MWLFLTIASVIFFCSAFFATLPQQTTDILFVRYLFLQASFINSYFIIFLISFVILTVIFFRSNFDKKYSPFKILFFSTIQTISIFFGGIILSFGLLMLIAFLHLTIFSIIFNSNPAMLGVVTDTTMIAQRLTKSSQAGTVVIADQKENQMLFVLAQATSGTDNFYGNYVLSAIPQQMIIPITVKLPSMLLFDDTLIVTDFDERQLETMSPLLGYLLIKHYFPRRFIQSYPNVVFMDQEEYRLYRNDDAQKKLEKIDTEIEKIEGKISSLSAQLKTDSKQKRALTKILSAYQYYEAYFKMQKEKMQNATEHIPNELGVFNHPDTIRIVFNASNPPRIIDYFAILAHEYLHYASFVSEEKRFTSSFFEEGLTEYFARNTIHKSFSTQTNLGYPVQVKIILAMTNMLTESELAEIYFMKDEDALARALNRVYGDHFYEENYILFETLQYTSDPKEMLQLANTIMEQIGATPLTERDMVSSFSD